MIGEYLYALNPRDQQVTQLDVVVQKKAVSLAGVALAAEFKIPNSAWFILKGITYEMLGGGAQTLSSATTSIFTPPGPSAFLLDSVSGLSLPFLFRSALFMADFLLPPDGTIFFAAIFSGGVSINSLTASVHGILIPRGSITRGELI